MIKGLLFDLDGVLFDTELWHIRLDKKCLDDLGYRDVDPMVFVSLIGAGKGMDPWEYIYRQLPDEYRSNGFKERFRAYKATQFDFPPFKELIYPEVKKVLKKLKEDNYLTACCSSSRPEYIQKALKLVLEHSTVITVAHRIKSLFFILCRKINPQFHITRLGQELSKFPYCNNGIRV